MSTSSDVLAEFIQSHQPLVIITGAGCSAASGIPTYRDNGGIWKRSTPIQHQDFVTKLASRKRYWARSLAGWPAVAQAEPNACHRSIAEIEKMNLCSLLVTQNVDRLHQRGGHQNVIDLHGRLDQVHCLDCRDEISREDMQERLFRLNPELEFNSTQLAPDGDADVPDHLIDTIALPDCDHCGGLLKPSVIFYGGSVAKETVNKIFSAIDSARGVLVLGSSLMVFSSYRFCRQAARRGVPLTIVNSGTTRADELASLKINALCEQLLPATVQALQANK